MENVTKGMLIILILIYIISPIDVCSGSPVDDIIVVLLSIAANTKRGDVD